MLGMQGRTPDKLGNMVNPFSQTFHLAVATLQDGESETAC